MVDEDLYAAIMERLHEVWKAQETVGSASRFVTIAGIAESTGEPEAPVSITLPLTAS